MRTDRPARSVRRGLSFAELLVSVAILTMIATAVGMLASSAYDARELSRSQSVALQHARVVRDRLEQAVSGARFSASFPGVYLFSLTIGTYSYPDTLVVWKPVGNPVDAAGLPRRNELIIFRPDPADPSRLLEITDRTGPAGIVPVRTDLTGWQTLIGSITTSGTAEKILLSDLLRVSVPTNGASSLPPRGNIRFRTQLTPSDGDIASYQANVTPWSNLAWPLGLYGQNYGRTEHACFWEMQLVPEGTGNTSSDVLPFFGSCSLIASRSR